MVVDVPEQLGLPSLPRVVFERSPLALALCQVRFPTVYAVDNPSVVASFQEALRNRYPLTNRVIQNLQIHVASGEDQAGIPGGSSTSHEFRDIQGNWTAVLTADFVSVETRTYQHFDDFLERLREVVDVVSRTVRPVFATRLGLRYINEIRPSHSDWSQVVRGELLGPLKVPGIGERARQAIQQLVLEYPEGHKVQMTHGFLPSGAAVPPRQGQEVEAGPLYVLDFDSYQEFLPTEPLAMNAEAVCECVTRVHGSISDLFRWSITEEYASTLGVQDPHDR